MHNRLVICQLLTGVIFIKKHHYAGDLLQINISIVVRESSMLSIGFAKHIKLTGPRICTIFAKHK